MTYKVTYATTFMPGVEIVMELPPGLVYPINFVVEDAQDDFKPIRFWAERSTAAE